MKVPKLRFVGFIEDWRKRKLNEVASYSNGGSYENDVKPFGKYQLVTLKSVDMAGNLVNSGKYIDKEVSTLNKGTLVMILSEQAPGLLGMTALIPEDNKYVLNQRVAEIRPQNNTDSYFLSMAINRCQQYFSKRGAGTKVQNISKGNVENFEFYCPTLEEQQKIGYFFKQLDKKIQLQQEKINLLKEQKKGYMQKIFSQELRFKDADGNYFPKWETNKLSHFLTEHKVRNYEERYSKNDVLSVSGEYGVVNQIKFQGRSFAGESVANYHVVHTGDIVYTKSPLKSNPYGIIKCNKKDAGIVSTMYAVYSCKENINGEFLDYYFQLDDHTNSYLRPLVNKGAKNDMKVNNQTVLSGIVNFPSVIEQNKIVDFLNKLDIKISLSEHKLNQLQQQKKYFMQQMFI